MNFATFYNWRNKYGGMDISMMARKKELEAENRNLERMHLQKLLKEEMIQGNSQNNCDAVSGRVIANASAKQRESCIQLVHKAFSMSEICYWHQSKRLDENAGITDWLIKL